LDKIALAKHQTKPRLAFIPLDLQLTIDQNYLATDVTARKCLKRAAAKPKIAAQLRTFAILVFALCWSLDSVSAAPQLAALRSQLVAAEKAEDNAAIAELGRRVLEIAPTDSATWAKLARAQVAMREFERCSATLDRWEKAVKPRPEAIDDFRGDVAFAQKDYANAERHWIVFITAKLSRATAANTYAKLADLCVAQSRWSENLEFRTSLVALEDSAANRVERATALLRLHRWDQAYIDINKANTLDPSDTTVKEWAPQFERLQKFLPELRTLDAQIAKSPDDIALLLEQARIFTLADQPLLALENCERAMKRQPGSMRSRIQTAEALLDTGRADDAAKLQVSKNLARADDKHVSEAALRGLAANDVLLSQNPNNADALTGRAKILRELKQFTLALADARTALAINDKSAAAHFEAAHDFEELGQARDGLAHVRIATELDPNDWVNWSFRGVLEAQRANFPAAIESQTRSLKIHESLFALQEREKCERRIGKMSEADVDLRRIRGLTPQGPK
jgi:tetratricopeptide (TPR) repeat protein